MREVLKDTEDRMKKALASLDKEFGRLRTGRASSSLLDGIRVDYYDTPTPLDAGQTAFFGPAAVAIHDDGHVAGQLVTVQTISP